MCQSYLLNRWIESSVNSFTHLFILFYAFSSNNLARILEHKIQRSISIFKSRIQNTKSLYEKFNSKSRIFDLYYLTRFLEQENRLRRHYIIDSFIARALCWARNKLLKHETWDIDCLCNINQIIYKEKKLKQSKIDRVHSFAICCFRCRTLITSIKSSRYAKWVSLFNAWSQYYEIITIEDLSALWNMMWNSIETKFALTTFDRYDIKRI